MTNRESSASSCSSLGLRHSLEPVMHFTKRTKDRLMIAAESRPSSYCHPERSAARAVVEEKRRGGGWAGRRPRACPGLAEGTPYLFFPPARPAGRTKSPPAPPP